MATTPFEDVFQQLNQHHVRYLVVGGLAVVLHGHLRATADIDLVLALDRENVLAAIQALKSLDYRPRPPVPFEEFAESDKRSEWIQQKGLTVFSAYSDRFPGVEIDLFVSEPFQFDEAYTRSSRIAVDQTIITVLGIDDLIQMKRGVGRPLDLSDVEALEAIQGAKESR